MDFAARLPLRFSGCVCAVSGERHTGGGSGLAGIRLLGAPGLAAEGRVALGGVLAVAGWCGLFVLFAYLRAAVQQLLTKVVFRQANLSAAIHRLRKTAADFPGDAEYLPWAAARIAEFVRAERFEILHAQPASIAAGAPLGYPAIAAEIGWLAKQERWNWVEAAAPLAPAQEAAGVLLLGPRQGGRRYLSEDLRALNLLAAVTAEEVERFRAAEVRRLVSEAELRALQSQINPHFLFNALNTLYGVIPREARRARETVLNLSGIFRYILQSDRSLIPLAEEIKIVDAYLQIERLRLGARLSAAIQVEPRCERASIPVLSIQPLVENAVKHGVAANPDNGWLRVTVWEAAGNTMTVRVEDSGPGGTAEALQGAGVGLANVTRRLQLHYGPEARVNLERMGSGTRVEFSAPLS